MIIDNLKDEHVIKLVRFTDVIGNIIGKLTVFLIKNIGLISILASFLIVGVGLPMYLYAPELFKWVLSKFSIDSDGIEQAKLIEAKDNYIAELNDKLKRLEESKRIVDSELARARGEKEGILQGIQNLEFETINWRNVGIGLASFMVGIGVIYYFLFSGSDAAFFKPLYKAMAGNTSTVNNLVTGQTTLLNEQLMSILKKIEDLELTSKSIQNAIDILNEKKK